MQRDEQAVVLGASVAGLLAAKVLSAHFEQVLVVDRDELPLRAAHRRGVPQSRHAHALLVGGRHVLDQLLPGFSQRAVAFGAALRDPVQDCCWFLEGGWLARPSSPLEALTASRPLVEGLIREAVLATPNIRLLRAKAQRLVCNSTNQRVLGVQLGETSGAEAASASQPGVTLRADLTVDATGRASQAPAWLQCMGYAPPPEEHVVSKLCYTSRLFRRPSSREAGNDAIHKEAIVVAATADCPRGGVLLSQEGGLWIVTLNGYLGAAAPEDLAGFRAFAASLAAPLLSERIAAAEPVGEAFRSHFPASRRRFFERCRTFPAGFLVIGDALCSFNPVYGQGMSVAAYEAQTLQALLAEGCHRGLPPTFAQHFFRQIARVVDTPWQVAAGNDLRLPGVEGRRTLRTRFTNWYMRRFLHAARTDAEMAIAMQQVTNLLASPAALLRPRFVARALAAP